MIVAVLAGGRGRRRGAAKATADLAAAPLIARPLAAARDAGLEAVVVAKRATVLPELDVPVLHEALAEEASLRATLARLAPARFDLAEFGDPAQLVASVNTSEQLAAAARELRQLRP